jgi:hypothetical protein
MGAGIGSGLAMGIASGRKRAAAEIRDHIERNGFSIIDRMGKPVKVDQFLEEAISASGECCSNSRGTAITIGLVLLGLLIMGALAAVFLFLRAGG